MKRISLTAILAGLLLGGAGFANAASFGVYIGDGHSYGHRHHHNWRNSYAFARDCRVVVRHHYNRRGERVTVRRRICD
jgi:hypothetical protein